MNAVLRPAITVALVVLLAGCTSHAGRPTARATTSPSPASTTRPVPASGLPGNGTGCGDTPISPGQLPGWTADAGLPPDLPYAVSREANVVAVLFGYPLRAGHREDGRTNKILWEMRDPRDGKPLHLTARPPAGGAAVNLTREADSTPGCSHMTLEGTGHTATIDLPYGA